MPHSLNTLCLLLLCSLSLNAEPRNWTSTSGSKIEATYLGSFDEDLWFESANDQRQLLKMPAKYISAADLALIETKEVSPQIDPKTIDSTDASISLLENLFKTKVTEPIGSTAPLEAALNSLVDNIPQTDESKVAIKLHRKVDEAATRTETITGPTVYACLQSLAEAHELKWSIRKGTLNVRPR